MNHGYKFFNLIAGTMTSIALASLIIILVIRNA